MSIGYGLIGVSLPPALPRPQFEDCQMQVRSAGGRIAGGSCTSVTDLDVAPAGVLFGNDLAYAVRHDLHVRQ